MTLERLIISVTAKKPNKRTRSHLGMRRAHIFCRKRQRRARLASARASRPSPKSAGDCSCSCRRCRASGLMYGFTPSPSPSVTGVFLSQRKPFRDSLTTRRAPEARPGPLADERRSCAGPATYWYALNDWFFTRRAKTFAFVASLSTGKNVGTCPPPEQFPLSSLRCATPSCFLEALWSRTVWTECLIPIT